MTKKYVGPVEGRGLIFDPEHYGTGDFCCNNMNIHTHEKECIIKYHLPTRRYVIQVQGFTTQQINFCPWCGRKLPQDLSDKRSEILFDELGINDFDNPELPEEFKTDEWWKKRGL